jgi:hypothetical protein
VAGMTVAGTTTMLEALTLKAYLEAARLADWQTAVLNGGPPCFHLEDHGGFCLRAQAWEGHGHANFHKFQSLQDLLYIVMGLTFIRNAAE